MRVYLLVFGLLVSPALLAKEVKGSIVWSERVELSPLVSGVVAKVSARVGQQVRKGDVLLSLESAPYQTALQQANALLESADLDLQEAQKEWERAQELYDRTVLSDHELATAKVNFAKVQAAREMARTRLARAGQEMTYSELRAPFDGVVVELRGSQGQTVISEMQSQALVTLARYQPARAQAWLSMDDIATLKIDSKLSVSFRGSDYRGRVAALGVEPNAEGLYSLQVDFEHKHSSLRMGEPLEIDLQ